MTGNSSLECFFEGTLNELFFLVCKIVRIEILEKRCLVCFFC
ncbi:hypothetical protein H206_02943 [Candidatus Electrothrix aarhusensis]|uniref:Uncharacterized protein n=1 Tax=Candidatus Electrothrix aarhusensis TaxID=1859131 RepID=A0A444IQY3_9BACT|nr:hypothetical protein H206_02943 [Candidatus Electrothrix aarhusensis]